MITFKVAHLEARRRKRHLKAHGNGRPRPLLLLVAHELYFGAELRLFHTAHAFYLPHDGVLARLVLGFAFDADELHAARVRRRWYFDLDLLTDQSRLEVGLDDDFDLHFAFARLFDERYDAKGQVDVLGGAVFHELEFAIGRYEAYRVVRFEFA